MKKLAAWHIGAWTFVVSLFMVPVILSGFKTIGLYVVTSLILYIGIFYINIFWILPSWIRKRKLGWLLFKWFGLVITYTLLSLVLNRIFHVHEKNGRVIVELVDTFLRNCIV